LQVSNELTVAVVHRAAIGTWSRQLGAAREGGIKEGQCLLARKPVIGEVSGIVRISTRIVGSQISLRRFELCQNSIFENVYFIRIDGDPLPKCAASHIAKLEGM